MGQENFAGPEYFTEFDPEKFIRDMKQMADMDAEGDVQGAEDAQANTESKSPEPESEGLPEKGGRGE